MHYNRAAAIATQPATGNRLATYLDKFGQWDGICRVEADPPTEETPPTPAATPTPAPPPKDEPLGESGINALRAEREQRKALEQRLKAMEQQYEGVDPSQFQELLSFKAEQEKAKAAQEQKKLEEQQQYEAAKQRMAEEHAARVAELQNTSQQSIEEIKAERTAIAQKYENLLISTALNDAFLKANGDPAKLEMLNVPAIRGAISLDGDQIKVADSDQSIADWMTEKVKPDFLFLFRPEKTASGSGTPPNSGSGQVGGTANMSMEEFMNTSPAELARRGRLKAG